MYVIKRTEQNGSLSYYKYDGWQTFKEGEPLDLSGVVLFTKGEAERMYLPPNTEAQWYGAYKR